MKIYFKNNQLKQNQNGFTLIELMVVVAVMMVLATLFIVNIAGQRASRDIKIAQNELVSTIRKTQSYVLSSRLLPNGQIAQYYLLKFDLSDPTTYKIQALYDTTFAPKLIDVETIKLPPNIQIATTSTSNLAITVKRSLNPLLQPIYTNCAIASFAAPYAKVVFNDGCSPTNSSLSPVNLNFSDDYYLKVINFQNNIACDVNNGNPANPPICTASTDSVMTITLTDKNKKIFKSVSINGITGAVTFN